MKLKADYEKQKSQGEEQKLRQWKKDKALQVTKEVGKDLLLGMANGLSMYGQVTPSLYFGAPLPPVPNYSNNTKKW